MRKSYRFSLDSLSDCLGRKRGRVGFFYTSPVQANLTNPASSNVIAPDSEAVFYGVLDFLAKPVFGALLLWGHRNIDPARLGLQIRDYNDDTMVHEKRRKDEAARNGQNLVNPPHDGPATTV